jgi:L-alanine-DL-glutamate epimerase-like enolase superfamily enzyme
VEDGVTPSLEQATATPAPEPRSIRHTTTSPFEQEEHEQQQQQRTRLLSASQRWIMGHTTGEDASSAIPRHLRLPYLTPAGSTAAVNLARMHLVQATEMRSWDLGGASKAVPSVDVWGSDHEYEEVQQQRTTVTSLSVASTSSTASSSSAKRSRKGSSSSGSIADPDDDNDEEEEGGGGVGVLWSMEVHKQVWRFFTPSQLA